jgi:hypothetical protein
VNTLLKLQLVRALIGFSLLAPLKVTTSNCLYDPSTGVGGLTEAVIIGDCILDAVGVLRCGDGTVPITAQKRLIS